MSETWILLGATSSMARAMARQLALQGLGVTDTVVGEDVADTLHDVLVANGRHR